MDWDGNVVWSYALPAAYLSMHHDIERLPNGNTLILAKRLVTDVAVSTIPLIDDSLIEIDQAGNTVWTWDTHAHYDELGLNATAKSMIAAIGGDWSHCNQASVIPANSHTDPRFAMGNIILSYRYTNTVVIINKASGRVDWRIGPVNAPTFGQHDAHMIESGLPGAGNILIFDNGSGTGYPLEGIGRSYSRLVEFDPLTTGTAYSYTADMSGEVKRSFYSDIVGSAQRLPNGNTLAVDGVMGRIFEVDPSGTIVWEFMNNQFSSTVSGLKSRLVYRAHRLSLGWVRRGS